MIPVKLVEHPYKHYVVLNFFKPKAFALLNEFSANSEWDFFNDENFPQYVSQRNKVEELFLSNPATKNEFSYLFSKNFINNLQSILNCSLEKCVSISFHKLTEGCFNVIHNDLNSVGEKVRIVCYLSKPENYQGGELNLFTLLDQETPTVSYKLASNAAFIFAMTENSLHSVSKVTEGERICLVITYQ